MLHKIILWFYHTFIYFDNCKRAIYGKSHHYRAIDIITVGNNLYEIQRCYNCDKLRKVKL